MILSSDLVSFVANNIDQFLQPVGTLEDVTLAVWFQSLQVDSDLNLISIR